MTYEEAHKYFEDVQQLYTVYRVKYCDDIISANDIAILAIEKQIPKKPVGNYYAQMRCPSCNHRIPSGMGSSSRRRDNWCNYCGQKIDWSNIE